MSKFQYDDAGFLKGELVDLRQQDAQNHAATMGTLRRIDRNVAAIKDLAANKISRRPAVEPQSRPEGAASRGGLRRYTGPIAEPQGRPASEGARRALASGKLRGVSLDDPRNSRTRDASGRFVSNGGRGGAGVRAGGVDLGGLSDARINKLANAVGAAIERSAQVDPAVTAVSELKAVVEPLGRGAFAMLGRSPERKRERWYERIWRTLGGMSKQDALNAKMQDRRLREMAAMGMGRGGGGGGGLFGGGVPGSSIPAGLGAAAGGLLGGLATLGKGALKGAGVLGKGALKMLTRLPVVGGLVAGAGALASMFADGDPNKTADENRADRYRGVGGAGGMFAGGLAGAKAGALLGTFLGPAGTLIGGALGGLGGALLGETFGEKLGEWTKTLVDADIPGMIGETFTNVGGFAKEVFTGLQDKVSNLFTSIADAGSKAWETAKGGLNTANDAVKNATGIDVKKSLGDAADAAVNIGSRAWDSLKSVASTAKTAATDAATATKDFAVANAPKMVPNTIRRLSSIAFGGKKSEVVKSRMDALETAMDAAGITDPNERAMFMAQMHHESNGFRSMNEIGGGKRYEGRKDLGNTQAGDGERFKGRGFIQLTGRANYRDMGKKLGLDLENNPELAADPEVAAKIATLFWQDRSRARKFGGGKIAELARAGDVDAVTQGINGGMNGADHRRELYGKYIAYERALTAGVMPMPAQVQIPPPVAIPPMPDFGMPALTDLGKAKPAPVIVREPIGQDVGDRAIAHIVTGGLGGA